MIMVKLSTMVLLVLSMLLLCASTVLADIPPGDTAHIRDQVVLIENAVNRGDAGPIINLLSPNARPNLRRGVEKRVEGKSILFEQRITSYQDLGDNRVKVEGTFAAQGAGWHVSGFSNYFVFEKIDDSWLLVDTDFHNALGAGFIWTAYGGVVGVAIIVLMLIPIGFWAFLSWQRRSREQAILYGLLDSYSGQGLDASALSADSSEGLSHRQGIVRRLVRFFFGGDIGYIHVRGLNYELVSVRVAMRPRRSSSLSLAAGPLSYQSSRAELPVEYHFIVRTNVDDKSAFSARLKRQAEGLVRRQTVGLTWTGGRLAETLNSQADLSSDLMRFLSTGDQIRVVADQPSSAVRIVLILPAEVRRQSFLIFSRSEFNQRYPRQGQLDVINRIAGIARSGELSTHQ